MFECTTSRQHAGDFCNRVSVHVCGKEKFFLAFERMEYTFFILMLEEDISLLQKA